MAIEYWSLGSRNPVLVNKTIESLKTPANCSSVTVPILTKEVGKNRKFILLHERSDKRLSNIKKGLVL